MLSRTRSAPRRVNITRSCSSFPPSGIRSFAAVGELLDERLRNVRRRRAHEDRVVRRVLAPPHGAVAEQQRHVAHAGTLRCSRAPARGAPRCARWRRPARRGARAARSGSPDPVPISSTVSCPGQPRAARGTCAWIDGCEIVCPLPIGSGASSYARCRTPVGTKRCRGVMLERAQHREVADPLRAQRLDESAARAAELRRLRVPPPASRRPSMSVSG